MVYESYPWKQDLMRRKRLIKKYNTAARFDSDFDATYTVIEKAIFYTAFIIRKLIDCGGKLSDDADNYEIHVKSIKPIKHVDNLHRCLKKTVTIGKRKEQTVDWKRCCNWLIHSYIFFIMFEENGRMLSFCVSSDKDRNKTLYMIFIDEWLNYIDFIAADEIVSLITHYDEKINDYRISLKSVGKYRTADSRR
jgi:hypothetical protein